MLLIHSLIYLLLVAMKKTSHQRRDKERKRTTHAPTNDGVKAYECEILNLGLLLMEFNDGIRENDGNRIVRCWQYIMMLVFKAMVIQIIQ